MPPITAVPNTSPTQAKDMRPLYLYSRPASSAPHMLPGKASRLPVPMSTRRRLVTKAMLTPYQGPSRTAARTFTRCWTGKHLDAPMGMYSGDAATPKAISTAARTSFFVF